MMKPLQVKYIFIFWLLYEPLNCITLDYQMWVIINIVIVVVVAAFGWLLIKQKLRINLGHTNQCDQIWKIFVILNVFGNCLTIYLIFGKMLNFLWNFFNAIWHIFIVNNGQYVKNYVAIWSHWCQCRSTFWQVR